MASTPTSVDLVKFGEFEVSVRTRELRRCDGGSVRLPDQSFAVLAMLLERPGELVSRDEIRKRLWSADTFVDFDHGLNNAVNRLRDALGDSADAPRFIETLPRRGYRFIGAIEEPPANEEEVVPGDFDVGAISGLRSRRRVYWWIALAATLSVVIAVIVWRVTDSKRPAIHTLAVLPFQNLSSEHDQEYFADGMTDELITMLAKNGVLRVVSRTSVMRYKKVQKPLREIAQELGADGILEGSVARRGNRVHVTAQLIHAGSDTHVWAESYDRDVSDVSALQSELARAIARQIGLSTSAVTKPAKPINPEAHDAYLLGRYYWFTDDSAERSRQYFQKAIDLQPDYAAAWSGLADSYIGSAVGGEVKPEEALPQGDAAARKAAELDDSLPEAHNSLAAAYLVYRWDPQGAERESARAVELNPGFAEGHHLRGYVFQALNRTEEAIQEQKKAMELDPFARPWELAYALMRAHQFDAALKEARLRSQAQPDNVDLHDALGAAYLYKGMEKEAAKEWEVANQLAGKTKIARSIHQAFQSGGVRAVFEYQLSNDLRKKAAGKYVSPLELASIYASLKHKDEVLRYLEQSYRERAPWLVRIQSDPDYDFVHSDPRYQAIVKKMGLPQVW